jgi:hypothetical protein
MRTILACWQGAKTELLERQALRCGPWKEAFFRGLAIALNGIAFAPTLIRVSFSKSTLNRQAERQGTVSFCS